MIIHTMKEILRTTLRPLKAIMEKIIEDFKQKQKLESFVRLGQQNHLIKYHLDIINWRKIIVEIQMRIIRFGATLLIQMKNGIIVIL